jgi:hypothetical protein
MADSSRSEENIALETRVLKPWAENFCQKYSIDPITIAIIIQAIVAVIRLIIECREKKAWPSSYRLRYNENQRRLIKYAVLSELGLWNYWRFGNKLVDELSKEDINEIHRVIAALPHLSGE